MTDSPIETVYEGRFLQVAKRGAWEYTTRANATGVVAVVAVHDDGRVVLVEQHRPPVNASVIEIPAGLVGDEDDSESLLTAAQRELEEETGYAAAQWTQLPTACTSPGLTDEAITFFLAQQLTRMGEGGGVASEDITTHEVPLEALPQWLESARRENKQTSMKLLAGLYAASAYLWKTTP